MGSDGGFGRCDVSVCGAKQSVEGMAVRVLVVQWKFDFKRRASSVGSWMKTENL